MKLFGVFKPVLYLGFLLGLVPYSIKKRSLFIPASLYTLTLIFLVWQSCVQLLNLLFSTNGDSLFQYGYLLPLQMFLNSLITFTSLISVLYRHHQWIELFDEFKYVENFAHTFQTKTSFKTPLVIQTVGIIFLLISVTMDYYLFYFRGFQLTWIVTCGQLLSRSVEVLLLIEFLTYITVLRSNFDVINGELDELLDFNNPAVLFTQYFDKAGMSKPSGRVPKMVAAVRSSHGTLSSLSDHINQTFSVQLLVSICKSIILITVILYTVSLTVLGKNQVSDMGNYLAVMISSLVHNLFELLVLVFICSSVCGQVRHLSKYQRT